MELAHRPFLAGLDQGPSQNEALDQYVDRGLGFYLVFW